jgi:hypothetical protein
VTRDAIRHRRFVQRPLVKATKGRCRPFGDIHYSEVMHSKQPPRVRDRCPHRHLTAEFSAKEQVDLMLVIGLFNSWNRLAIGFGMQPTV